MRHLENMKNILADRMEEYPTYDYDDYLFNKIHEAVDTYVAQLDDAQIRRLRDDAEDDKQFMKYIDIGCIDSQTPERYRITMAYMYLEEELMDYIVDIIGDVMQIEPQSEEYRKIYRKIKEITGDMPDLKDTPGQICLKEHIELSIRRIKNAENQKGKFIWLQDALKVISCRGIPKKDINRNALVLEGRIKKNSLKIKRIYIMDQHEDKQNLTLKEVLKGLTRKTDQGIYGNKSNCNDVFVLNRW